MLVVCGKKKRNEKKPCVMNKCNFFLIFFFYANLVLLWNAVLCYSKIKYDRYVITFGTQFCFVVSNDCLFGSRCLPQMKWNSKNWKNLVERFHDGHCLANRMKNKTKKCWDSWLMIAWVRIKTHPQSNLCKLAARSAFLRIRFALALWLYVIVLLAGGLCTCVG